MSRNHGAYPSARLIVIAVLAISALPVQLVETATVPGEAWAPASARLFG